MTASYVRYVTGEGQTANVAERVVKGCLAVTPSESGDRASNERRSDERESVE